MKSDPEKDTGKDRKEEQEISPRKDWREEPTGGMEKVESRHIKTNRGNIMGFLTVGIALLAISILVMASFSSMGLMLKKLEVSQAARKYILVMETKGCLTEDVRQQMFAELSELGLKEIDIAGTTIQPVEYGDTITLRIRGRISGNELKLGDNMWSGGFEVRSYYVEETRMSTAKN